MKNKKKHSSQTYFKNDSKHDKYDPNPLLKKSPSKNKSSHPKSQGYTPSEPTNLHPFNKTTLFYGKKYHYSELNPKKIGDSNQSSTHCSFNNRSNKQKSGEYRKSKSKSLKGIKTNELRHQEILEQDEVEIRLNSVQIMELINTYATKIQRQWRLYWFRKCLRFVALKERESKHYKVLMNYYHGYEKRQIEKSRLSYDLLNRIPSDFNEDKEKKRQTLPKLPINNPKRKVIEQDEMESKESDFFLKKQQETSNDNQLTQEFYNNKKYASLSSINSGKLQSSVDISAKNKDSQHERTSSLGQKIESSSSTKYKQKLSQKSPQIVQIGINCSLKSIPENSPYLNPYLSSTPVSGLRGLEETIQKKSSQKKSNIKLQTKVYECIVDEIRLVSQNREIKKSSSQSGVKNLMEEFKLIQKHEENIKSAQSINSKYETKFPSVQNLQKGPQEVTKMFKKYKKAIENEGNKKISKIMKHFEEKQITQRTYKNLIQQTKEKTNKEIKTLELKQGHFQNTWKQVYVMYKDYVRDNSFHQGETPKKISSKIKEGESQQHDEHSVSFDKWDFESSAKKSISQLESFEDFARELNQRNPEKLKGFFIENKKISIDNKPIELVLDELDRLQNDLEKDSQDVSEFKDQGGSIFEEFKQRERTNSFQKKSEHVLVENIAEKKIQRLSYAEMKSPHVSPQHSPKQSKKSPKKSSKIIPEENQVFEIKNPMIEPKRVHFEFPDISTPPKSVERQINVRKQVQIVAPEKKKVVQVIKSDDSDHDSEVEMKITSISVGEKDQKNSDQKVTKEKKAQPFSGSSRTEKIESQLFVPENHKEKLENSLLKQIQAKKQQQRVQEIKKASEKKEASIKLFEVISKKLYDKQVLSKLSPTIRELTKVITSTYREKQRRKEQQQAQLLKYPPSIDPTIDAINSWLLEISHHLLDHHNAEIKRNLVNVKQLPNQEMLQICHSESMSNVFFETHSYVTITEKIFKEFEFFYLKNVANNLEIKPKHEHNFEHLLYGFHRCLIDSMNLTLLDELIIGRNWTMLPWIRSFRYRKNETAEHAKQCLERAINRVSGWAEYSLGQLEENGEQVNVLEWKQYQEEKMNIVIKEEVVEEVVENEFVLSWVILQVCREVCEEEMSLVAEEMREIQQKRDEQRIDLR